MLSQASIPPELFRAADVLVRDYLSAQVGDTVLVTTDSRTDAAAADAIMNSAYAIGAISSKIVIPQLPFQGALANPYIPRPLAAAVADCDVWIDLTFPYLAGSNIFDEVMKARRTRYFLGGDLNAEALERIFGKVDFDRHYVLQSAFDKLIAEAVGSTVHVTNARGSDVTFKLVKHGFARPRRAENGGLYLVPGSCTMFPDQESVRGVICIDAAFHEYYAAFADPIVVRVDGRIRSIGGGGAERRVFERALRRAGNGEYGYVIHFSHGIHRAARVTGQSFVEDMRVVGNSAIGFGLPFWVPGGGENHPDGVMSQHSFSIDNTPIVSDGAFVLPNLAKLADELEPMHW